MMPLADRDVNARPPRPVNNATSIFSIHRSSSYISLQEDEHASPPPRKVTPPSHNLLKPTRASAARTNSPTTTPPTSRLPRLQQGPASVPRVMAAEASGIPRRSFTDKPLPSRPIVALANTMSPSKDGRCLLDAAEQPLQRDVDGVKSDYPTLTPRSVSTPDQRRYTSTKRVTTTPSSIPRRASATMSMITAASEMTKVFTNARDSKMSTASSTPSFVSASESKSRNSNSDQDAPQSPIESNVVGAKTANVALQRSCGSRDPSASMYPARKESLRARIDHGNLKQPGRDSLDRTIGFTDFTKETVPSTPKAATQDRSPANFSRPRPRSGSVPSRFTSPSVSFDDTPIREQVKSRIPITGKGNGTLVNIKIRDTPSHDAPRIATSPSLEARKKVSPHTMKVLGQGVKRRELQRANTNASTASTVSTVATARLDEDATSNEVTPQSAQDKAKPTSPVVDDSASIVGRTPSVSRSINSETGIPRIWEQAEPKFARAPPSCSPFTGPLQTIHSQATLPLMKLSSSTTLINSASNDNSLPSFAETLREDGDSQKNLHEQEIKQQSGIRAADTTAIDDDNDYKASAAPQAGITGTDEDASHQLRRTLSKLNGEGSPPKTDIEDAALRTMFQSLRIQRGPQHRADTSSFSATAAAAELYLQGEPTDRRTSRVTFKDLPDTPADDDSCVPAKAAAQTHHVPTVSKWSDSTPSAPKTSTGSNSTSSTNAPSPPVPPKDPARSIGYPSSGITARRPVPKRTTDHSMGHSSRNSSPTLGLDKRTPGCVRTARSGCSDGYAKTTAAAESKKTSRTQATASEVSTSPPESRRGRNSTSVPARAKSTSHSQSKVPRSRSKSRIVLDKIQGLLHGKRDKKTQHTEPPPPLPPIERVTESPVIPLSRNQSPTQRTSSTIQHAKKILNKSPSWPASRHESRATIDSLISGAVPVGHGPPHTHNEVKENSVLSMVDKLMTKANREPDDHRKLRMLKFAATLSDSVQAAREAGIAAETAKHAAVKAEHFYTLAMKGSHMLETLASSLVANKPQH